MGFQQIATHRPFWQPISTQATHALLFDLRQSKMVINWHPPVSIFWWLIPDICHWIKMYTGHEIYNLHIVLTCPFVLSAIYCEQVEKQVIEFSFSSILHTDTGLCQSSLVSPKVLSSQLFIQRRQSRRYSRHRHCSWAKHLQHEAPRSCPISHGYCSLLLGISFGLCSPL